MPKTAIFLASFVLMLMGFESCKKDDNKTDTESNVRFEELVVSPDFGFKTSVEKSFSIKAYDNLDSPIKAVRFDIYTAHPDSGGVHMLSGATNADGVFAGRMALPSSMKSLVVTTSFLGFPFERYITIDNSPINLVYGGRQKSLNVKTSNGGFKSTLKSTAGIPLNFLGSYNSQGVPNYLEPNNDPIGADLLDDINASLPERRPVPQYNPEYLNTDNQTSLSIVQESDVWVTFVHEGAGNKNTLCFYTYDINNPPATINDISSLTVIYPNVSFVGSGGGMISGNKVLLGRFPANTKIGWALLANGFNGTINPNVTTFFSDTWLNPEVNSDLKQHTLMLLDPGRDLVLLSFEDQRRDGSCDNDFNDAIFYVTANPVEAIQYTSMPLITYVNPDTDFDGIPDIFDEFPTDPTRAFTSYFPGESTYGTLAFEDLWPDMGDYDFNDLVIRYRFSQISNGNNEIVEIMSSFIPVAMGANLKAGFGFQIPGVSSNNVQSVTGMHLTEDMINLASNGTEAGQSDAVFIAFDKAITTFSDITGQNPNGMIGLNTMPGGRTGIADTINLQIEFTNPMNSALLGLAPYNPFIFVNSVRSHEIHLPDYRPTDLVNTSLFGTQHDNSNPSSGRYYRTVNNLPWAINIVDSYDYTIEEQQINAAFNYFNDWATSSGVLNKDWYKNLEGYRDNSKIYN